MNIETDNIIGFSTSGRSGKFVQGVNPVTGELIEGKFAIALVDDVDAALEAADNAFKGLKKSSPELRAEFLEAIADEMEALGDALVQRASAETGLPEARIIGERGRTTGQLKCLPIISEKGPTLKQRLIRLIQIVSHCQNQTFER